MWKKLIFALTLLVTPALAQAAITSDAQWEVRSSGDNTNGSCFDTGASGTDYSQQDAAQLSITDGVVVEAAPTTLTSVTAGFTSAMVGNCFYIASGTNFTVGYYLITAYTSSTTVTIDRDPTDGDGGDGSGGTLKVGGAADDPEQVSASVVAGNTVWIKAGTYTVALNVDVSGGGTTPIAWKGYNTTRDDKPTGTDRPLIDCASTLANGIVQDVADQTYRHVRVANCTGDGILYGAGATFINVKSSSNGDEGWDDSANVSINCFRCESASNGGFGFEATASATASGISVGGTYIHDNTSGGVNSGNQGSVFYSVVEANSGDGIDETLNCINSIAHGNTGAGSDGFDELISTAYYINCVSTSNGQYGFSGTDSYGAFDFNAYNGNGTAGLNVMTSGENDLTSAPNFTDSANGDYTYQASSAYIGTGFPNTLTSLGLIGDYQMNIGLDQDDNTVAGGVTGTQSVGVAW